MKKIFLILAAAVVLSSCATEDNMSNIKMQQRDLQTPPRFLMPRFSDLEKFYAGAKALKHGLESTVKIGGVSYEIFFTDIDDPTDLPDEIETKIGAFDKWDISNRWVAYILKE